MKHIYILFLFISSLCYGQMSTRNYIFDGLDRSFNIYVPTTYDANVDSLPIVFFFHGMGGNMNNFSGLTYKAEQEKYIMLVPQGITDPLFGATWNSGAGALGVFPNSAIDDVGFVNSMIDSVSKWYQVDPDRIYSTGFSMGGFMTNRLACEMSSKFAAIASVAGTIGNRIDNTCEPNNIVPALHIHSISDQTVAYTNNSFGIDADELFYFWATNNNCQGPIDTTDLSNIANDGFSTWKYLFNGGYANSEVELYMLDGPQHNESFFNLTSGNDFDAIEVIWDFFARHENIIQEQEEEEEEITSIRNIHQARFEAFPNPASHKISLKFDTKVEVSSISITNTLGKIIDSKTYDTPIHSSVFDVSDKASGIYFFQIKDIEGNLSVMRFFKK